MTDKSTPFIKFTYTILNPDGLPQEKSWVVNSAFIVSAEADASNDLKLYLANSQIITILLGDGQDASEILNEILSLSAAGLDYSVYKIDAAEKKVT